MMKRKILAINPGSTSTKIAVFEEADLLFEKNIHHSGDQLKEFVCVADQFDFRKKMVFSVLQEQGIALCEIAIVVGRGGLVKPIESGIYKVNDALANDLTVGVMGQHASNLGGLIARSIAASIGGGVSAYIVDPVVVDEMDDVARVAGHPLFTRQSIFHALNQKAVARMYAESKQLAYHSLNLIVAHMGGGVSVGAHRCGRVVDVNNALDGTGAFSPERSGTLESGRLVELCFSGNYTQAQIRKMIAGEGGLTAHLGYNNTKMAVDAAIEGDRQCKLIIEAFAYQVGKEIGAMATALKGSVDAILLTGGIAYSDYICTIIKEYVSFIAPVEIIAGEDEMRALAMNGLLLLDGKIEAKEYS